MQPRLKILMLEDVASDAELVERELSKSDLAFDIKRVEAADQFAQELQFNPPDLVLADNGLPPHDGFFALYETRSRHPEIPFIFVSGSLGEEKVIRAFEGGAFDCVLKHHLSELVPAVKRALSVVGQQHKLNQVEADCRRLERELQAANAKLANYEELIRICSSCKKIRDQEDQWQPLETYLLNNLGIQCSHGLCPDCIQKFYTGFI